MSFRVIQTASDSSKSLRMCRNKDYKDPMPAKIRMCRNADYKDPMPVRIRMCRNADYKDPMPIWFS